MADVADDFGLTNKLKYTLQRDKLPANDMLQPIIAPLEHREFAQSFTEDHPILGPISLAAAIPAYTAYKAAQDAVFGRPDDRTPAGLDEVFAGFQGIARGIRSNFAKIGAQAAKKETGPFDEFADSTLPRGPGAVVPG